MGVEKGFNRYDLMGRPRYDRYDRFGPSSGKRYDNQVLIAAGILSILIVGTFFAVFLKNIGKEEVFKPTFPVEIAGANMCYCSDCTECNSMLNDPFCDIIQLTKNATSTGTCINNPPGADNKVFDCNGFWIIGARLTSTYGVAISDETNFTVMNCNIINFFDGINMPRMNSSLIFNNRIYNNAASGIYLIDGYRNTIRDNYLYNNSWAMYIYTFNNSVLENNYLESNDVGIYIDIGDNISFIRNYILRSNLSGFELKRVLYNTLNLTNNVFCDNNKSRGAYYDIFFNAEGGEKSGLNNTCNTTLNWNDNGYSGCKNKCGMPITEELDLTIVSPLDNTNYTTTSLWLNVSLNNNGVSCNYTLDSMTSIQMTKLNEKYFYAQNTSMTEGDHNIIFSCTDTYGQTKNESSSFGIYLIQPSSFVVTAQSPGNSTYAENKTWFNATTNQTASSCRYNLDGSGNATMSGTGMLFYYYNNSMTLGQHNILFYCNNSLGIWNSSSLIYFTLASCIDTDNGKDYNDKGTCSSLTGGGTDDCSGGSLIEQYCDNSKNPVSCSVESYECPDYCDSGRCKTFSSNNGGGGGGGGGGATCTSGKRKCLGDVLQNCSNNLWLNTTCSYGCNNLSLNCNPMPAKDNSLTPCTESDWNCGNWGSCTDNRQTRECQKLRNCDSSTGVNKEISKSCVTAEETRQPSSNVWLIIIIVVLGAVAGIVIWLVITKNKMIREQSLQSISQNRQTINSDPD